MTLSYSPEVIISSICGIFWELNIIYNIVSPWLYPILNEVPDGKGIIDTPDLYHEVLIIIYGLRRPRISALWLGAIAGGLILIIL